MTIIDLSIISMDNMETNKENIAEALIEVKKSGLDYKLHDMGTTFIGPLDKCMDTANKVVQKISKYTDRLYSVIKIDNVDKDFKLGDRTLEVERLINETLKK